MATLKISLFIRLNDQFFLFFFFLIVHNVTMKLGLRINEMASVQFHKPWKTNKTFISE